MTNTPHPSMGGKVDASSDFVWPPAIYASAAVIAGILSWLLPLPPFLSEAGGWLWPAMGALVFLCGVALAVAARQRFSSAGTEVRPTRPTTVIVQQGVYGHTRNPMYLGMTLMLLGLGIASRSTWFLLALVIAVYAVTKLAIEREERYLDAKFGDTYRAYRARVPRWFGPF
ncbi:MAG: methyltransferase family protein [Hyphomicrobiales bacterium]